MHTYIHLHAYIHTFAYIHTCIHTYIQAQKFVQISVRQTKDKRTSKTKSGQTHSHTQQDSTFQHKPPPANHTQKTLVKTGLGARLRQPAAIVLSAT